jgi:hypothetical protein
VNDKEEDKDEEEEEEDVSAKGIMFGHQRCYNYE